MVLRTWIWGSLALGIGYLPKGNDGELDPQNRVPKLGPEVGPTIRAQNWAHNLGPRAQIPDPWAQNWAHIWFLWSPWGPMGPGGPRGGLGFEVSRTGFRVCGLGFEEMLPKV